MGQASDRLYHWKHRILLSFSSIGGVKGLSSFKEGSGGSGPFGCFGRFRRFQMFQGFWRFWRFWRFQGFWDEHRQEHSTNLNFDTGTRIHKYPNTGITTYRHTKIMEYRNASVEHPSIPEPKSISMRYYILLNAFQSIVGAAWGLQAFQTFFA